MRLLNNNGSLQLNTEEGNYTSTTPVSLHTGYTGKVISISAPANTSNPTIGLDQASPTFTGYIGNITISSAPPTPTITNSNSTIELATVSPVLTTSNNVVTFPPVNISAPLNPLGTNAPEVLFMGVLNLDPEDPTEE